MKKNTTRLTAALCATLMSVSMASATASVDVDGSNAAVNTAIQDDIMLIDEVGAPISTPATMQYGTITAIDGTKLTVEVTATETPYTTDVMLTEGTAIVDCATGMAYDPNTLTVGEGVYLYTAANAFGVTALVANIPMDMQAPTMVTVADITFAEGDATITDVTGATYTLRMGTTILNRYVAWNMPATLDMPLPEEIVVGRNLLINTDFADATAPLYRVTMLPMIEIVDPAIDLHDEVAVETTTESMILINGEPIEATTIQMDGETLFPLRAVAEPFGIDVSWDVKAFCPWVTVNGENVTLPFGDTTLLVDDTTYVTYDVVINTLGLEARLQQGAFALTMPQ